MLKLIFSSIFLISQMAIANPMRGKYFSKVIFIVFENTNYSEAMRQPFFKELAKTGTNFNNLAAIGHPSQPNYIALTSGSTNGVTQNNNVNLNVNHIGDLLEQGGLNWKVYLDDYPGNCFTGGSYKAYGRKHNPFISFLNVQKNKQRCQSIVNSSEFYREAKNNSLPSYSFFVPNMNNSGHDTGAAYADKWYRNVYTEYLNNPELLRDTLIVTTFDENSGASGNIIYTNFNGGMVRPNLLITEKLNFYSLIKLVEENWGLGSLNKGDSTAPSIPFVWQ